MAYPQDYTDKKIAELEKRLNRIYRSAYAELQKKTEEYFEHYEERWEKQYNAMLKGKYTEAEFKLWEMAQLGRGKRWEQLRDSMAENITKTNVLAAKYINEKTPDIFGTSYNYAAYEIEKDSGIAFNIYNEAAVRELLVNEPDLLPKAHIDIPKDERWNKQKMTDTLISSIMQGKSISEMADSFQHVTNMNRSSALRNARTAMVGAMNAGRQKNMTDVQEQAKKSGLKLQKMWCSAHDSRTRESHAHLDGVTVDIDEKFPNGLMYPGDVSGRAAEIYNCRCFMKTVVKGITGSSNPYREEKGTEDYKKWLEERKNQNYRPLIRGKEESSTLGEEVILSKVLNSTYDAYVSNKVNIGRRDFHKIERTIDKAIEAYGGPKKNKPRVEIVAESDIKRQVYGSYSAEYNRLMLVQTNNRVEQEWTIYHEMWHWKQAQRYLQGHENITKENKTDYMEWLNHKCKKSVERLGIQDYNVSDISQYAYQMLFRKRFDEVEAEYYTALAIRGKKK